MDNSIKPRDLPENLKRYGYHDSTGFHEWRDDCGTAPYCIMVYMTQEAFERARQPLNGSAKP